MTEQVPHKNRHPAIEFGFVVRICKYEMGKTEKLKHSPKNAAPKTENCQCVINRGTEEFIISFCFYYFIFLLVTVTNNIRQQRATDEDGNKMKSQIV